MPTPEVLKLPADDIRASEMVFWLKKLSLDLPNVIKPTCDIDVLLNAINQQTSQLGELESQLREQNTSIAAITAICQKQNVDLQFLRGCVSRLELQLNNACSSDLRDSNGTLEGPSRASPALTNICGASPLLPPTASLPQPSPSQVTVGYDTTAREVDKLHPSLPRRRRLLIPEPSFDYKIPLLRTKPPICAVKSSPRRSRRARRLLLKA